MNKTIKIGAFTIGAIIIFSLLVSIFYTLLPTTGEEIQKVSAYIEQALTVTDVEVVGTIATPGAHSGGYGRGSLAYDARVSNVCTLQTPIHLYCMQKGNALKLYPEYRLYEEIEELNGTVAAVLTESYCHAANPELYKRSNSCYICVGNHSTAEPALAYIASATQVTYSASGDGNYTINNGNVGSYSAGQNISQEIRQIAMWMVQESSTNIGEHWDPSKHSFTDSGSAEQLANEAVDYVEYETRLNNTEELVKETTEEEKVQINVNQEEQYLIIGPYKMEYLDGVGSITGTYFAGISNMVVKGYNDKEKEVFLKDIEIESFYQGGVEYTELIYFEPNESEYVYRGETCYPDSEEEFYIKIKNPNQGILGANEVVRYIDIDVEFSYMRIENSGQCILQGYYNEAKSDEFAGCSHSYHSYPSYDNEGNSNGTIQVFKSCTATYNWVTYRKLGDQRVVDIWADRYLYKTNVTLTGGEIDITMQLGGYVWEDVKGDKDSSVDGIFSDLYSGAESVDKALPNIKVTLYECQNGSSVGEVADLLSEADKAQLTEEEKLNRVNPQMTDENGYYQFDGLNSSNKYYVTFEYNGQIYLPTEYLVNESGTGHYNTVIDMVDAEKYNTQIWEATSKGTEDEGVRTAYNNKFGEIQSSPKNYKSSNSLKSGVLVDGYNESFSIYDLMGYELNENGAYVQTEVQLIDGFYKLENGYIVESDEISEGIISKKIREYIEENYKYPEGNDLISLYAEIAGNNQELWKKLQYIEDCKINAYTGSPYANGKTDLYPVYDDFTIDNKEMVIPGEGTKPPIYEGQYYVNLGLWRRQENNLALVKDVYRAATRINGKTEIYEYDKRSEDYWEIQVRMQDYNNYYGTYYNRELYPSDYKYTVQNTNLYGSELELYVTYKITIRNSSQNILNEVTEVVDYYDKDYTYMPNLSWVMYKDSSNEKGYDKISVSEDAYYNMMDKLDLSQIGKYARNVNSSYATRANSYGTYCGNSIYGKNTQQDLETKWNSVYINGLDGKKLATGEQAYIYLTFKVNSDSNGPVILDDNTSLKENYVEINGYESYYADGTELPNDVTISGNNTVAGIVDKNSTPGNLCLDDLKGEKYEKNFEDDTDRAKSIKVLLDETAIRGVNGTVWEDERTEAVSDSIIGDGVRQDDEIGVQGVTVELVEILKDNNGNEYEYVWQTTTTGSNKVTMTDLKTGEQKEYTNTVKEGEGRYEFAEFIPGNYIVRFIYGHNKETVVTVNNGGENSVSYNGQDFKSTVYQQNLNSEQGIANYTDEYYNIQASDKFDTNVSDAKDLWENKTASVGRTGNSQTTYNNETYQGRTTVNAYSETVTNHKAEVLASPYAEVQNVELLQELVNNTYMTAETAIIVAEVEYNRTNTDGYNTASNGSDSYLYGNDYNSKYTLNNIDFGLTERPKAGLELDKKVTNVKISLANGNILFDSSQSVENLIWLSGNAYNLDSYMEDSKYKEYYDESKKDSNYHRYSYRTEIDKLLSLTYASGTNGLITATMDEELMHGSTIQIEYLLTVKNVGETDYTGQDFYYKATGATEESKVTTAANIVVDYVANNLQYREADNQDWKTVTTEDLTNNDSNKINDRLVNNSLLETLNQYNVILQTSKLNDNLKPGEQTTKDLSLTQLITAENSEDDKTYDNIAEIVQVSNTVGRRMAYSIVGNQDPTTTPSEVDSAKAEQVIILPPFGQAYLYYGLAVLVVGLLVVGTIWIKKKVLKY